MKKNLMRLSSVSLVAAALAVASVSPASALANCVKGDRKPPYKLGWSTIYSVPTWMKETHGTIDAMVDQLKKQGLVDRLMVTDAGGEINTQIQNVQSMIDAGLDGIFVISGSSTALDRVISDACAKGIAVTNFDGMVDTNNLTSKFQIDQKEYSKQLAQWLVDQLHGKGNIIILNGPAGISFSDERRQFADSVLKANPGIKILAETNTPYVPAPAQEAVTNLLFSHPDIDGVFATAGALAAGSILAFDKQGRAQVPITGDNYRPFLEAWKEKNLTAFGVSEGPNWGGALGIYILVQALQGKDVPLTITLPLDLITKQNLDAYLTRAKDFPPDGVVYSPHDTDTTYFDSLLTKK
jgi:ribose transport system substrate-binding protein